MTSPYPSGFNTDVNIPRVDGNLTEIGGDAINGLRDAIFALERTLGLSVQGSATNLVTRLNTALDANGNLKPSAIAALWAGAPITNSEVANNAGIEETKLDLDYDTYQLKTWIDTLRVRVNEMYQALVNDISNLAQHTGHPSSYGRHRTSDIDGYITPQTPWTSNDNLQGILHGLYDDITDHIADPIAAHEASAISVDDTNFISAFGDDVQEVLESLDQLEMKELTRHRDRQHSNGILNTQETTYGNTSFANDIVQSAALNAAAVGLKYVEFTASPPNFASIQRDDSIVITQGINSYVYKVDRIESLASDTVFLQGFLPISLSGATATVYKSTEETFSPSVLKNTIKSRAGTPRTSVFAIHPNAPYVIGNGLNPGLLVNGSVENIRFEWYSDYYGNYQFDLESKLPVTAYDRTPQIIVDACNLELTTNHIPIVAFLHENEIGFALDEGLVDGYLTIATPTPAPANSAWAALGISEGVTWFSQSNRNSYIDGYESASFAKIIDTTAALAGTNITFTGINPEALGVARGHLVRVVNGVDDGTYMVNSVTNTQIQVITTGFTGTTGTIKVYNDTFYEAPVKRTLYETFVDIDKETRELSFNGVPRIRYSDDGGFVGQTIEEKLNIVAVSRNFTASTMRIIFDDTTDILQLGEPSGIGLLAGTEGPSVVVPAATIGKIFRLYDASRTAYIEVQMLSNALPTGGDALLDCYIEDRISEEFHLQTGTVLQNITNFLNLSDNRLFGTIGRQDIRTDFKRDYTSYPISQIRGNGIIYGFQAGGSGTTVTSTGGEVLVNGSVKNVDSKSIAIPADSSGTLMYNLFVDENGELNFLINDSNVVTNMTPSLEEIISSEDKVIIAQITTLNGSYVSIADLRRFVNNLDNKIELIVENEDITAGSFATIAAACNWINAISTLNFPIPKTIRIRGDVIYDATNGATTLPNGVTLVGDGNGILSTYGSRIYVTNNTGNTSVLIPQDNCTIRDIAFEAAASSTSMTNGFIGGSTVDVNNLKIEGCSFTYPSQGTNLYGIVSKQFYALTIKDCLFLNNGTAITNDNATGSGAILNISNCAFENCLDYGIYLTSIVNAIIENNQMSFTTLGATTKAMAFEDLSRAKIDGNIISTNSVQTALSARIMIFIDVLSTLCQITNNDFINTTSNTGFGRGIVFWNSGVGIFQDHVYITIGGNNIENFYGSTFQKGIEITKMISANICNNIVSYARICLDIADASHPCDLINVTGNEFGKGGTDSVPILRLRNASSNLIDISNNKIFDSSLNAYYHSCAIEAGDFIKVDDNIFKMNTTTWSAIALASNNSKISNNLIGVGASSVRAPISLTVSDCQVSNNRINYISLGTSKAITAGGSTIQNDVNNIGQKYSITLSSDRGVVETSSAGLAQGTWAHDYGYPAVVNNHPCIYTNTFVGSEPYASFTIDATIIPVGALMTSIEILYDNTGAAAELHRSWIESHQFTANSSNLVFAMAQMTAGTGTNKTETLTPVGGEYMGEGQTHHIILKATAVTTELKIWAIRINYTL